MAHIASLLKMDPSLPDSTGLVGGDGLKKTLSHFYTIDGLVCKIDDSMSQKNT